MAAASAQPAKAARPQVNLFDMPELMPGAQPSANPAQREEFQQRCRQLHRDSEQEAEERANRQKELAMAPPRRVALTDLEAMFPALDPALIRSICADFSTPQQAIDTLLQLAAATNEPGEGGERPPSPPPRNVGVEDHEQFPTLVDADGWQVPTKRELERDKDEELGSAWRDLAKATASLPAPRAERPLPAGSAWGAAARRRRQKDGEVEGYDEQWQPETDYEFRHRVGQIRAKNRAQYGRRGASGKGGGRGATRAVRGAGDGSGSEDEGSEDARNIID